MTAAIEVPKRVPTDADRAKGRETIRRIANEKEEKLMGWLTAIKAARGDVPTLDQCRQYLALIGVADGKGFRAKGLEVSRVKACIARVWPKVTFQRGVRANSDGSHYHPRSIERATIETRPVPQPGADPSVEASMRALRSFQQMNDRLAGLQADVTETKALLRRVLGMLGVEE